ncbi:MAG: hypothetical protein GX776_08515, partial [Oxalobacter sp.]|nr:hypothetical protein [Oxalobacter sp.]
AVNASNGGQGAPLDPGYTRASFSKDDLLGPFSESTWNRTVNASNGGQGAPLDPGYLKASFSPEALAEPVVQAWDATGKKSRALFDTTVQKSDPWLAPLGDTLKDSYTHAPDTDPDYIHSLADASRDGSHSNWAKDLGIAPHVAQYKVAAIAARLAANMASPGASSDTVMQSAASDYRFAPEGQTGNEWANERNTDFLEKLVKQEVGVLQSERQKLEDSHSEDYRTRRLFNPDHNILTSPAAVAGFLTEDIVPGVVTVLGLTQGMGGGSTSWVAKTIAPYLAEGVATYYAELDEFHDTIMAASEDDLVYEYPEYASLLGRYPDTISAKKELIRQRGAPYAYKKAVESIFLTLGMNKFIKSTRTGAENKVTSLGQHTVSEGMKESIKNKNKRQ